MVLLCRCTILSETISWTRCWANCGIEWFSLWFSWSNCPHDNLTKLAYMYPQQNMYNCTGAGVHVLIIISWLKNVSMTLNLWTHPTILCIIYGSLGSYKVLCCINQVHSILNTLIMTSHTYYYTISCISMHVAWQLAKDTESKLGPSYCSIYILCMHVYCFTCVHQTVHV